MGISWKNIENWRSWKMRFFWGGHFEFFKSAILKFFLLHLCEKSSSFIWGNIFFCTMDGFSRILEKKLCHLLCTRLYIDEEPGIKIFYCTEEFTKIRQRHLLLEQTFTWNSPIILPPLFFWQENLLWNCYIVTATLTCTIIKGHACLFFSRKKSSLSSDFHVIDWKFHPTR